MQYGDPAYMSELKCRMHNTRQKVESLRKRRKHARGLVNRLRAESAQAEKVLATIEADLQCARAMSEALRLAYHEQQRDR